MALVLAIRFKESDQISEVVVIGCGVAEYQETLRMALAMGADRAILIETETELQPLAVAKLMKAVTERE